MNGRECEEGGETETAGIEGAQSITCSNSMHLIYIRIGLETDGWRVYFSMPAHTHRKGLWVSQCQLGYHQASLRHHPRTELHCMLKESRGG